MILLLIELYVSFSRILYISLTFLLCIDKSDDDDDDDDDDEHDDDYVISNSGLNARWWPRWRSYIMMSQASCSATIHKIYLILSRR